jgi:hypothetical protein
MGNELLVKIVQFSLANVGCDIWCLHPSRIYSLFFTPFSLFILFHISVEVPLTGFETGIVPTESISQHNKAVILKYWQFFFENCPAVLQRKLIVMFLTLC